MGRGSCCTRVGLQRGPWTPREDTQLKEHVEKHGEGNWRMVPRSAGILRCGKSCRLRWMNYLRPNIKRGNIEADEEDLIIRLHALLGNRWSLIAGRLPGRTDNEIKNYWNTHLCKSLRGRGIDPTTHRPLPLTRHRNPTPRRQQRRVDADQESRLPQNNSVRILYAPKAVRPRPFTFFPSQQSQTVQNYQTKEEIAGSLSLAHVRAAAVIDDLCIATDQEDWLAVPPIEIKDDQIISTEHTFACELSSWADVQNWFFDDRNYNHMLDKNITYREFVDGDNMMLEEDVDASGINCPLGGQEPILSYGDLDWDI